MSILFQQDFDNIHVSFYRNMKSHVVEKMIISRVMRGICSDYYKDVVHGLLNRQENTVFPNIYRDVIKNEIKEEDFVYLVKFLFSTLNSIHKKIIPLLPGL